MERNYFSYSMPVQILAISAVETVSRKFYQVPAPSTKLLTRLHFGQLCDYLRLCHAVGIVKS